MRFEDRGTRLLGLLIVSGLVLSSRAQAIIVIDDFAVPDPTTGFHLTLSPPPIPTSVDGSSLGGAGALLGGERDVRLTINSSTFGTGAEVHIGHLAHGGDTTSFSVTAGVDATTILQYDGVDGTFARNPIGLGAVDLTQGGANNSFVFDVLYSDQNAQIQIDLTGPGGATATMVAPVVTSAIPPGPTQIYVPFALFTPAGGFSFTNVGSIQVRLDGPSAQDTVLGRIAVVPEPSAMALLGLGALAIIRRRRKAA